MNLVILDTCRSNPFPASTRAAIRALAKMEAPTGSMVAYSTAQGELTADGLGSAIALLVTTVVCGYALIEARQDRGGEPERENGCQ